MRYLIMVPFLLYIVMLSTKSTPIKKTPITLVKLKDTVYHCEEVTATPCGYYLSCGRQSFYCAKNIVTEVLQ